MTNSKQPDHVDRISALEAGQKATSREIAALREGFDSFASDVRRAIQDLGNEQRREIASLQAAQIERSKTPWGPIISAASLTVALVGGLVTLGASGPLRELSRIDAEQMTTRSTRFSREDGVALRQEMHRDIDGVAGLLRDALQNLADRFDRHVSDGHPFRVTERVEGLDERVRLLEARDRAPSAR